MVVLEFIIRNNLVLIKFESEIWDKLAELYF